MFKSAVVFFNYSYSVIDQKIIICAALDAITNSMVLGDNDRGILGVKYSK